MRLIREGPCIRCGAPVRRKRDPDDRLLCWDCSGLEAADAARQMAAKSGPAWERWLASNAKGARKARVLREQETVT